MTKIKNISFAGGGFYGYGEVGALKEMEKYSEYFDLQNIKGVSVGSIIAALYSINYSIDELSEIIFKLDIDSLIRDNYVAYYNLYEKFGMYEAKKLELEIERLICVKTNIKNCTFCQIEKNLTIISTNLNYQCPVFFNKENTPEMPISKAVRMSISYPLIMAPVLYKGDLYGDGGEFINYPINTFSNLEETIGITFASHNEDRRGMLKNRVEINNLFQFLASTVITISRSAYVSQITEKYLKRSIIVHITEKIDSMQFNLTMVQKKFIYDCGVKAVQDQLHEILGIEKRLDADATAAKLD